MNNRKTIFWLGFQGTYGLTEKDDGVGSFQRIRPCRLQSLRPCLGSSILDPTSMVHYLIRLGPTFNGSHYVRDVELQSITPNHMF